MRPVKLFISYASEDWDWKDRLLGHLLRMVEEGLITVWHDRFTEMGEEWEEEIYRQMNLADVAILLVSKGFLKSKFIQEEEIPRLRRRYEEGKIKIFPLILKPCNYQKHDLIGKIQFLGKDRLPLSQYQPPHLVYTHVVAQLIHLILPLHQTIYQGQDTQPPSPPPSLPPLTLPALLDKLPKTNPRLFGREREMALLDGLKKGVMVWVAGGGTGKSALVRHWLLVTDWPKETRFIGHSFYSQGTKNQTTTSATFLSQALHSLGVSYLPVGDYQLGELLAQTLRTKPTVLVLDGVESLQHGPGGHHQLGGLFKDQGLVGLLSELARQPGEVVCLVSSRVPLADLSLQEKAGRFIWQYDLDKLPEVAAVELMKYRGVNGLPKDLLATAQRYNCHALALVLVSEYLHTFHQGRVEKALEINLMDESTQSGRHAKSVMRAYDLALQKAGEELDREMVRLLGLFDRPAEWSALESLQKAEPIPSLTHHFRHASPTQVAESLARLRQWGLLNPGSPTAPLDTHPLVREWFGQAFQQEFPTSFIQAHKILFRHFQRIPEKEQPDSLEEMAPLYRAIRHGCLAGEYEEALVKVYRDRILRGDQAYSLRNFGAHSSDLSALSGFFPHGFDQMPVTGLSEKDRSWLVAQISFLLMSLGRLREAVGPRRVGMQREEQAKDWSNAAISAQNLTDLLLSLGRLGDAGDVAEQGVSFASNITIRERNLFQKTGCHAYQGRVAHYMGRMAEAGRAFQQAETLQKERQPFLPRLFSLRGTDYALFLLEQAGSQGGKEEVLDRGIYIGERFKNLPMETALGKLVTGLALESLGRPTEGASQLQAAVADMRRAGRNDLLPWLLLSHAGVLHRLGNLQQAKTQLAHAMEIAERGEMVLYLAEGYLLTGEMALDEGRREEARAAHQQAKTLIEEMGYLRRQGELVLLEGRIEKNEVLLEQARNQFVTLGQLGLLSRAKITTSMFGVGHDAPVVSGKAEIVLRTPTVEGRGELLPNKLGVKDQLQTALGESRGISIWQADSPPIVLPWPPPLDPSQLPSPLLPDHAAQLTSEPLYHLLHAVLIFPDMPNDVFNALQNRLDEVDIPLANGALGKIKTLRFLSLDLADVEMQHVLAGADLALFFIPEGESKAWEMLAWRDLIRLETLVVLDQSYQKTLLPKRLRGEYLFVDWTAERLVGDIGGETLARLFTPHPLEPPCPLAGLMPESRFADWVSQQAMGLFRQAEVGREKIIILTRANTPFCKLFGLDPLPEERPMVWASLWNQLWGYYGGGIESEKFYSFVVQLENKLLASFRGEQVPRSEFLSLDLTPAITLKADLFHSMGEGGVRQLSLMANWNTAPSPVLGPVLVICGATEDSVWSVAQQLEANLAGSGMEILAKTWGPSIESTPLTPWDLEIGHDTLVILVGQKDSEAGFEGLPIATLARLSDRKRIVWVLLSSPHTPLTSITFGERLELDLNLSHELLAGQIRSHLVNPFQSTRGANSTVPVPME